MERRYLIMDYERLKESDYGDIIVVLANPIRFKTDLQYFEDDFGNRHCISNLTINNETEYFLFQYSEKNFLHYFNDKLNKKPLLIDFDNFENVDFSFNNRNIKAHKSKDLVSVFNKNIDTKEETDIHKNELKSRQYYIVGMIDGVDKKPPRFLVAANPVTSEPFSLSSLKVNDNTIFFVLPYTVDFYDEINQHMYDDITKQILKWEPEMEDYIYYPQIVSGKEYTGFIHKDIPNDKLLKHILNFKK